VADLRLMTFRLLFFLRAGGLSKLMTCCLLFFFYGLIAWLLQVTEFLPIFQSDGDDENVHKLLKLKYNPESGQIVGKLN